ncbi:MAG: MoaD/ThiS family protein [Leptothrix sp. (in: b-proteobacteria)]
MKIQLRYFASLRESLGSGELLDLGDQPRAAVTVGAVRDQLIARGEPHAGALARGRALRAALNQTLCAESSPVGEGDELAFFPPVTGG